MRYLLPVSFCAVLLSVLPAYAAETPEFQLTLKNHTFTPQELTVPADTKIKLIIKNEDAQAAEFESDDLGREKIVPAKGNISVFLDPLKPGTYDFVDDFHHDTATGTIIAQ
jgi:heme/copper-type cytochrome/quinol oxidase subunit 2